MDVVTQVSYLALRETPTYNDAPSIPTRLDDFVSCVSDFVQKHDHGPSAVLAGGPDGTITSWVQRSGMTKFGMFSSVSEDGVPLTDPLETLRPIKVPVNQVAFVDGKLDGMVFSLWQSKEIYFARLQKEALIISVHGVHAGKSVGAVEAFAWDGDRRRLVWGTSAGCLVCVQFGEDPLLGRETVAGNRVVPEDRVVFHQEGAHGGLNEPVSAVVFHGDNMVISGGSDGLIKFWSIGSGELLTKVRTERSTLTRFSLFQYAETQTVLVSGAANGSVILWDVESILQGKDTKRLASLGNFEGAEIHSITAASKIELNEEVYEFAIIVGDDNGNVSFFVCPNTHAPHQLGQLQWILLQRLNLGSPVVQAQQCPHDAGQILLASCEHGVWSQAIEEQEDEEEDDDDEGDFEEQEEEEPVPTPLEKKERYRGDQSLNESMDSSSSSSSSSSSTSSSNTLSAPSSMDEDDENEDEAVDPEMEEEEEEEEKVEAQVIPHHYPVVHRVVESTGETCYDGFVDQDIPPLPLSRYHEPSLNSSEKIKVALEKIRLRKFDPAPDTPIVDEQTKTQIATRSLQVGYNEKIYYGLQPVVDMQHDPEDKPVCTRRAAKPQISKKFKRKTIMQRQQEEMEKHRQQRLLRAALKHVLPNSPSSEHSDNHPVQPLQSSSFEEDGDEEEIDQTITTPASPRREPKASHSFPWAKREFYLSKTQDGKVGFHNFRSLNHVNLYNNEND